MKHTFRGQEYTVEFCELNGVCDVDENIILLSSRAHGQEALVAAIHEAYHACHPATKEVRVEQTAIEIASFLWRLGYRKTTKRR